ncbi:16905_t:CDS:2 [Acaulospora colombiana]|uniref:16905_t:CDS:1 n=1 Tax=Acaulospora colombiana TaxID=27376 RepID=A0ACA9KA45_9GLOM|nr:16905_t:CDS:2 [Acaulospora colombiana]
MGENARKQAATEALNDMVKWFKGENGTVAIFDATNSTRSRREFILNYCRKEDILVMFIESVCQDENLILQNIVDVKLSSPDYKDMDPEKAAEDFRARISHYEQAYEPITESDLTYIKIINVGSQVHGESMYNLMGKIGGDSDLSPRGKKYALALPKLIKEKLGDQPLTVWTSMLKRTMQTGEHLPYPKLHWKALDELDAGCCDGMTYEEIEEKYPEDYANRDDDKFDYRYRGGESYRDVVLRLEPVIMELERQQNIMIIGHQAILRCIYAYFHNLPQEELPYIKIPLHTVIKLTPKAYGCEEERYKVEIDAVDTHRPKPPPKQKTLAAA